MSGRAEPLWYKDAVIYELRVRSFYDADGDGTGDLRGLTEKLGYLQDLGVTAIWLLPFYPSPLRDDGYDISDYTDVHPACGTLTDFQRFLDEAHRRGLRVITELVLNHTSDQHPWFQRARRAPKDSPERSFYVWSDTPERFRDARIIFQDYEPSNWSWDPIAHAYYWHRFYAHQPDLNYDNPSVRRAMLDVMDFWLGMGVDGLRLDAVPYLFEREGTTCENLPETHEFLRELRAHIDARWADRMLLAEANQWPEDAVAYFGKGDECHMAFHFPVMPRIFVAIQHEDRFPIADVLAQTPPLPEGCQWALFLRNHDELTLEMVTDEERDAMYRAYAAEPVMRINLGIRRRLAPLAGNDRRHVELMNGLLFSLPGTPVLYYGDEIGMGDNVYLGDRNGVRTPMQWSADKNAGFSRANPQRLELPVIVDPAYHYEAINVETQQASAGSLLWWTKRLIALRKRHAAFGRGRIELLRPDNPRILAFVRQHEGEIILVVANLSRFIEFVELDLSAWKGSVPVELFGRSALPAIGDAPYPLTISGHDFYWMSLSPPTRDETRAASYEPPLLDSGAPWEQALAGERTPPLAGVLARWATAQAWFAGRGRRLDAARIADSVPVGDPAVAQIVVLELTYEGGVVERYLAALASADAARAAEIRSRSPQAIVATIPPFDEAGAAQGVLYDAIADPHSWRTVVEAVLIQGRFRGRSGAIVVTAAPAIATPIAATTPASSSWQAPPSSSWQAPTGAMVVFGERFFADVWRRLDDGASPGLELQRFLAERAASASPPVPPAPVTRLAASVEYAAAKGPPVALVVFRAFVPSESDGLTYAVAETHRLFTRVLARGPDEPRPEAHRWDVLRLAAEEPPALVRDAMGAYLDTAGVLGLRMAELHLALVAPEVAAFAPEPFSSGDQRTLYQSMRNHAGRCLRELRSSLRTLPPEVAALAVRVLAREDDALKRFGALLDRRLTAPRTRTPGALDLGKVLVTNNDFIFVDLDGARANPTAERRRKGSPLRDAASMLRSFHEAAFSALLDPTRVRAEDVDLGRPWARAFWEGAASSFLRAYLGAAPAVLPSSREELAALLDAFLLESAFAALRAAIAERASKRQRVCLALLAAVLDGGETA